MQLRHRTFTGSTSDAVSEREARNRELARKAAAEGFVLLKNEGNVLPLSKGQKLALYGAGAVCTVKGGTGSGDVNERESVNIWQGLKNVGFRITSEDWLGAFEKGYTDARISWRERIVERVEKNNEYFFDAYSHEQLVQPVVELDGAKAANDGADTAVFVLRRIAGEGADRHEEPGDYYLTEDERKLLAVVSASYKDVILVINTGGIVDLNFADEYENISAIIQFMQAGEEGGNALGDVLDGDVTPSGKLSDTWPVRYSDYPNAETFGYKTGNLYKEDYLDGIYVGYRYFDTFDVPVRYSFGYGLSYTTFDMSAGKLALKGVGTKTPKVTLDVTVKNTGSVAGREVAQIYVSCPQGSLVKEYRRLAGFGKTRLLNPGESQTLKISFDLSNLTSYCEKCASWILEGGRYGVWLGNSLCGAKIVGEIDLDETAVVTKCRNICKRIQRLEEISPCPDKLAKKTEEWQKAAEGVQRVELKAADIVTETVKYQSLPDEFPGKAGEILEKLSLDQLVALATGEPTAGQDGLVGSSGVTVPGAAAETTKAAEGDPWNVASIVLTDGPAGLRLHQHYNVIDGKIQGGGFMAGLEGGFFNTSWKPEGTTYYQFCTAIPVGTLLAQTWDVELIKEVGAMIGGEMVEFETTLWLAPGMNIHRNPLCGRNFEYYSEDPLLSGMMAAAMTLGVQSVPGCGTTIKHFACNNVEDNRMGCDAVINERALREIYLKGFELAVKGSQPMSIMTSYNLINGVHAANCYDTCTAAARDEWGFAGAIMTDWTTTNASTAGVSNAAGCMRAGNDMVMPGHPDDHANIRVELAAGTLDIRALKRCVYNNIRVILASNQYEGAESWTKQFPDLDLATEAN